MFNENGDISHSLQSKNLEFFSKFVGGKKYGVKGNQALDDFDENVFFILEKMWEESPELTIKNIFQKGDCRGGAKEKRLFIVAMNWLIKEHIEWANIEHIPEYRYWKDLITLVAMNHNILHVVVNLFAIQLNRDVKCLMNCENVSLCAKWVPTEGCAEDKRFPEFLKALRKRLRVTSKELRSLYITPLRAHLKIVERSMCANNWEEIDYSKVPSVAMQRYRKTFQVRDQIRFEEWVNSLSEGKEGAKVNVSQLFPHDVVKPYIEGGKKDLLIEAQFNALVEQTRKLGTFKRSLVISDTSGSMTGTPLDVSISLGILISRCLEGVFKNFLINFDSNPTFTQLNGEDLHADVQTLKRIPWGSSTNLDKVFDQLLEKAIEFKVPSEEMPTRLFILTDMQFDGIGPRSEKGAITRAKEKFIQYEYTPPEIVCWNLRGDIESFATNDTETGVCMISGFTTSVMKCVMEGDIPDAYSIMLRALNCERYDRLNFPGKKASNRDDICGNE